MVHTVEVSSRLLWKDTGFAVTARQRLYAKASGRWVDAVIPCTADGYPAPIFYALGEPPRIPDGGRYFRLMGRIANQEPTADDPAETFAIGAACDLPMIRSGRLFVFCNDRAGFYWNNWGSIRLTLTTSPAEDQ